MTLKKVSIPDDLYAKLVVMQREDEDIADTLNRILSAEKPKLDSIFAHSEKLSYKMRSVEAPNSFEYSDTDERLLELDKDRQRLRYWRV